MCQGSDFTNHNGTRGKSIYKKKFDDENYLQTHRTRFTSDLQVVIVISETRRVSNYQPAKVLEADVELVPTADLPPVGAVDVICRDRRARSFLGFLLCAATTGYQGGRCPDEHICQMNDRKPFGLIKPIPETLLVP